MADPDCDCVVFMFGQFPRDAREAEDNVFLGCFLRRVDVPDDVVLPGPAPSEPRGGRIRPASYEGRRPRSNTGKRVRNPDIDSPPVRSIPWRGRWFRISCRPLLLKPTGFPFYGGPGHFDTRPGGRPAAGQDFQFFGRHKANRFLGRFGVEDGFGSLGYIIFFHFVFPLQNKIRDSIAA